MIKKIGAVLMIMGLNSLLVNAFACPSSYTACQSSAPTYGYNYDSDASICYVGYKSGTHQSWTCYDSFSTQGYPNPSSYCASYSC